MSSERLDLADLVDAMDLSDLSDSSDPSDWFPSPPALQTPHPALRTPNSALRTPHSGLRTPMPIYLIIDIKVTDPATYAEYVQQVPATIERYGGRYLARGGMVVPLIGDWRPERVVVVEFPSFDHMNLWLQSPEYKELAPLRERSTRGRAIVVEGGGV